MLGEATAAERVKVGSLARLRSHLSAALLAVLGACVATVTAADVNLTVSANRGEMYLGESVMLTVQVAGQDDPSAQPDLSRLADCSVRPLGSQSSSRHSISIVNGRVSRDDFSGRVFAYEVTPRRAGSIALGPVTLTVGGRVLSAQAPPVRVMGVEDQGWVAVELAASRDAVLVDEAFDVTLRVFVAQLSGPYADAHPWDPSDPPLLSIPYLGAAQPGLESPDAQRLLQPLLVQSRGATGFRINDYTVQRDPFQDMFNFDFDMSRRQQPAVFALPRRSVTRNGKPCWEYSFVARYVPKEESSHTFGPVLFKGAVATGVTGDGRPVRHAVFAVGAAVVVRVVPPPEEGRPRSYAGVLGTNLSVTASLDAQTCGVGDPLRLTLRIAGDVNLDKLRPPPFWTEEALTREFTVYEDTMQTRRPAGAVEYEVTVRPKRAGTIEVPPLAFSYYDVRRRAYQTVQTAALPLRVNEAAVLSTADVISAGTNATGRAVSPVGESRRPSAPMVMDEDGGARMSLLGGATSAVLAGAGPAAFCLTGAGLLIARAVRLRARGRRPRRALGRALRALARCRTPAAAGHPAEASRLLSAALRGYLADRLDEAGSLVPADCRSRLAGRGVAVDVSEPFCRLVERHFDAGFASEPPAGIDLRADVEAAGEALRAVEKALRGQVREGGARA